MSDAKSVNMLTVQVDGVKADFILNTKDFSTGSKGFFANGKLDAGNGKKYQIVCNVVLIGSKRKS